MDLKRTPLIHHIIAIEAEEEAAATTSNLQHKQQSVVVFLPNNHYYTNTTKTTTRSNFPLTQFYYHIQCSRKYRPQSSKCETTTAHPKES